LNLTYQPRTAWSKEILGFSLSHFLPENQHLLWRQGGPPGSTGKAGSLAFLATRTGTAQP
jgi:hypothetical protein